MPVRMTPITLHAGANLISLNDEMSQIGAIMLRNESDWDLALGGVAAGTLGQGAWVEQLYVYDNIGDSISVIASALPGITITLNTIIITLFRKGEPLPTGTWPVPLVRKIASSIITAQQVVQDGLASGLTIMESTPSGAAQSILVTTDGLARFVEAILSGQSNNLAINAAATNGQGFRVVQIVDHATNNANADILDLIRDTNQAHTHTFGIDPNGFLYLYDASVAQFQFHTSSAGFKFDLGLLGINGQATAGNYGVPPIIASVFDQAVTSTSAVNIISLSVPAGLYRISGACVIQNGTFPCTVSFTATYTAREGASGISLQKQQSGTTFADINGLSVGFATDISTWPKVIAAAAGTLTITYQDSTGTPNDHVSAIVERLA